MANQNEIDDIINEIRSKKESEDNSQNAEQKAENTKSAENTISDININDTINKDKPVAEPNNFDIISDSFEKEKPESIDLNEIYTESSDGGNPKGSKKKAVIIAVIAILVVAIAACVIFAVAKNKNKEPETTTTATTTTVTTTEAPVLIVNPLTGESSYNENAVGKRPVACVVENASAARPQWGIADSTNPPDIILEGEVEGGETRMLWFYADYTSLPDQIGPMRSARPPYIRFSELFDSIFIHWGQSATKDNYIGADSVFKSDNVDHINQMTYSDSVGLFGRDYSRGVASEHTGVLYGDKLEQAINQSGFRTDIDENNFSTLSFNKEEKAVGTESCTSFSLTFSSNTKTRDWTYSTDDKMYHCTDYQTDVSRKNLLVLYDNTEYIAKANYKGTGKSEIYCDYKLAGGNGKLVSLGTVTDITWSVENGLLVIKDANGNNVSLNTGTTWIGYASANHGGTDTNNTAS